MLHRYSRVGFGSATNEIRSEDIIELNRKATELKERPYQFEVAGTI